MIRSLAVGGAVFGLAAAAASGQVLNFTATLDGAQEVPPVATPGSGFATVTLTINTMAPPDQQYHLLLNGTFSNLTSPANASHIHGPAPMGVNAGVVVGLDLAGGTSGSLSFSGFISQSVATMIMDELTYINVHTSTFPGGEIRGQIIPAPGALALLGFAGLAATRRRR